MGINLTEISQKVLDTVSNASNVFRKMYDLHYNPNPLDVPMEYIDENGQKRTTQVPNRSKVLGEFEEWKNNLRLWQTEVDYVFTKTIPAGVKLDGHVLWNPRDLDAQDKSSYIILYDGAHNANLKYDDGPVVAAGVYLGNIKFSTANKGGSIWHANIGFLFAMHGHTNGSLIMDLPIAIGSHDLNGAIIKVQTRCLSTGNTYIQNQQILLYVKEGDANAVATEDIDVTLSLKRII